MILVHTLGTAVIAVGDCAISPMSPRKFALLLHLVAERGRRIPRSLLQELIFPDQPDRNARHSLRELFYQFRQLGIELDSSADGIRLPSECVEVDYEGIIATHELSEEQIRAASGGFLPGFAPPRSESFVDWFEGFRARCLSGLTRTLVGEMNRARNSGDWDRTERIARACLALDPLNEEATLALAEMLLLTGAKASAVKLLDDYTISVGHINPDLRIPARVLRRRIDVSKPTVPPRGTPRFVGRSDELGVLRAMLQRTITGEANCVAICGEPGIGKSRLLSEFRSLVELEGVTCASVAMQPHDSNRPLGIFVDLVPLLLQLPGALGCSPSSMEALNRLALRSGQGYPEYRQPHLLEAIAFSITEAIGDLCEAISVEAPLLLAIEDAHWSDQLSRNVLSHLISSHRNSRILILATTRDRRGFFQLTRDLPGTHVLPLRPLSRPSTDLLVENVLDLLGCDSTKEARSQLSAIAAGNPLFAISLATHYHDTGDSISIPSTVIDFLARRLEPLPNSAINVLTTCVVLGRHCTTDRLLRVLEVPRAVLLETLAELADLSLLDSTSERIAPLHPLIAEVVTKKSVPAVWRIINHGAAEVFEGDALTLDSPAHWWEAATRWREAGETEKALSAVRRCAQHAMAMGLPGDAARMLNEALLTPASRPLVIAAAKELVIAADLAVEPALVFRGRDLLRSENQVAQHDDIELALRHAMYRDSVSTNQVFEETKDCLQCQEATAGHRVTAAILALKWADMLGTDSRTPSMIEEYISAEDLLQVSHQAQLEFRLLVRSAKRDRIGAAEVAAEIIEDAKGLPLANQVISLHNAGTALFLAGRLEPALRAWKGSFDAALILKMPTQQVRIAAHIAGLYSDLRNDAQTTLWMSRAEEAAAKAPQSSQCFFLVAQQICRAFESGDIKAAECRLRNAQGAALFSDSATRRGWGRAFELLLRVRQGELTDSDAHLARCIFAEQGGSISGSRDLEIAASAEVLMTLDFTEATRLTRNYLETERDAHRLMDRQLVDVLQRLGLDAGRNFDAVVYST